MLSKIPEWLYLIGTIGFVQISYEIGFRLGMAQRRKPGENPETAAAAMFGATIGLLAFMLAFTFNGAASDHNERKDLVLEEANIVRTTYMRSMMLADPERARIRELMGEYVDIRVALSKNQGANLSQVLERTSVIQNELWSVAVALMQAEANSVPARLFAESLTDVFDIHAKRIDLFKNARIPSSIWVALYFLTFLTMAMLGFRTGLSGIRSTLTEISQALAFSTVLILIIMLNNPLGSLQVSQQPLIDVLNSIRNGI